MVQTLHCDNCNGWLKLIYKKFDEIIKEIHISALDMPILVCHDCQEEYPIDGIICSIIDVCKKNNRTSFDFKLQKSSNPRYEICKELKFRYDPNDCLFIPGLNGQLCKKGFFTPVFFDKKILHKYLCFNEYEIHVAGNTYGTIFFQDEQSLDYGINRNDKVFCWLGDLEDIPQNEKYYLRSENIPSDHDVGSEFYAGQIEAEFSDLSNENKLLKQRNKFGKSCKDHDCFQIFDYEKNDYEFLGKLLRPVNWNEQGVIYIINSLTKLCVESIYNKNLKTQINKLNVDIDVKDKKGLKCLEIWVELRLKSLNDKNILNPFFVLSDFRNLLDHKISESEKEKRLESCYQRLEITTKNFEALYDKLIIELTNSYSILADSIMES